MFKVEKKIFGSKKIKRCKSVWNKNFTRRKSGHLKDMRKSIPFIKSNFNFCEKSISFFFLKNYNLDDYKIHDYKFCVNNFGQ